MSIQNTPLDEQIFVALQAYEQIKSESLGFNFATQLTDTTIQRLSFNDIVNCAKAPHLSASVSAMGIINQSLDYRRKYRFVLMQISQLQSPRQVAASSSVAAVKRTTDDFIIEVDSLDVDGVWLILTLANMSIDDVPETQMFLHCEAEQKIHVLKLDVFGQARFRAKLKRSDECLAAVFDLQSHLFVTYGL